MRTPDKTTAWVDEDGWSFRDASWLLSDGHLVEVVEADNGCDVDTTTLVDGAIHSPDRHILLNLFSTDVVGDILDDAHDLVPPTPMAPPIAEGL